MFRRKSPEDGSHPEFEVVSGLHRGVKIPLSEALYKIGSSSESDIVLRDPGVAPHHATLRIKGGSVTIEATGEAVELGDGTSLARQHGRNLRLPKTFSLGEATIRLSGAQKAALAGDRIAGGHEAGWQPTPKFIAGATILLALPLILLVNLSGGRDERSGATPAQQTARSEQTGGSEQAGGSERTGVQPAEPAGDVSNIARELRARLQSADLGLLNVTSSGREVVVSGDIVPSQHDAWISVVSWFDQTFQKKAMLVSKVKDTRKPAKPPVSIQAVWFGDHPYMIASDGKRYYEGAFLNNGWLVRAIHGDRIVLAKGDEQLSLTY
jgi:hypothetical protein